MLNMHPNLTPGPHPALKQRLDLYRIDEPMKAAARKFWHAVWPEFHEITRRFYTHLQANPETARFLPDQSGIERLRKAQELHWEGLFTGHFDAGFVRRVNRTAEAHLRIRLPNYHYMAAYAFFLNELVASAERLFPDDEKRVVIIRAINTLVMIDMDLTMSLYMQRLMRGGAKDPHGAAMTAIP
jgi:hypothetical protein